MKNKNIKIHNEIILNFIFENIDIKCDSFSWSDFKASASVEQPDYWHWVSVKSQVQIPHSLGWVNEQNNEPH